MKTTLRLIGILTLICLTAGLLLAVVHDRTLEPIAQADLQRRQAAIRAVLPPDPATPVELALTDPLDDSEHLLHVRFDDRGRWTALATETHSAAGYGGNIALMAGFVRPDADTLKLAGIHVLQHAETPGLGAKIRDKAFSESLAGRDVSATDWRVRQDGGEIQAITAATISTRAVLDALRRAIERVERLSPAIDRRGKEQEYVK